MIRQILPNNYEKYYSNFSLKFSQLNTHGAQTFQREAAGLLVTARHQQFSEMGAVPSGPRLFPSKLPKKCAMQKEDISSYQTYYIYIEY
jgi:hypothetical protein